MKILVTGANGFIGSHLCKRLLSEGHEIVGTIRESSNRSLFHTLNGVNPERFNWRETDFSDLRQVIDSLSDIDSVYHCAGMVSFEKKDVDRLDEVNRQLTRTIVQACIEHDIPMCHFSSTSVFIHSDRTHKDWPLENPDGERSAYGLSKYRGELEVWRGREEGLNACIINPGIVLGYGDWNHGSSALFRNAFKEFPFFTSGITGFVGVNDVCDVAVSLMNAGYYKERFLLVEGNYPIHEIQKQIAAGFGKNPPRYKVSQNISLFIAAISAPLSWLGMKPLITKETAKSAHRESSFDGSRITEILPDFEYTPISEVIGEACQLYLSDLNN